MIDIIISKVSRILYWWLNTRLDCHDSIVDALELPQSCAKPSLLKKILKSVWECCFAPSDQDDDAASNVSGALSQREHNMIKQAAEELKILRQTQGNLEQLKKIQEHLDNPISEAAQGSGLVPYEGEEDEDVSKHRKSIVLEWPSGVADGHLCLVPKSLLLIYNSWSYVA